MTGTKGRAGSAGVVAVAVFWAGMLIGVSFLATPAKFLAPSLSLPVALDVGRHTFAVFNKVEWLIALVLLGTLAMRLRPWPALAAATLATALVAVESFWLLPVLDHRVGMIIAGRMPPPSQLHNLYIVIESIKLIAVVAVAVAAAWAPQATAAARRPRPIVPASDGAAEH